MDFQIQCPCGLTLTVSEAAAGRDVQCACGRNVPVPSWMELRERAGLPRYHISPEVMVEHLLGTGELPFDEKCVRCEEETDQIVRVLTTCEVALTKSEGTPLWATILLWAIWWPAAVWSLARAASGEEKTLGRNKIYWLPLRVCPACRKTLRSQKDIKLCLRAVPLYDQLLDKFPDATVSLGAD
jgi:hypothetical protein